MAVRPSWLESATSPDATARGSTAEYSPVGRTAVAARVLVVLLGMAAAAIFVNGLVMAWTTPADDTLLARVGDFDMRDRAAEYRCFRQGVYPNQQLAGPNPPPWVRNSPYPPYAFPMLALFFEPGGALQGRILLEAVSLTALFVIGWFGARELAFAGPAVSAIGALAGIAITGNSTVFALGHFSILCMGLVVGQIALLRNGRPVAAGICWALAMIKPQIALAFAPLFMIDRQWRGLAAGGGLLVALGLSACWWTGVPPLRAISGWWVGLGQSGTVSTIGQGVGPGSIAAALDINPRHVHKALLVVLGGSLASMSWWLWRRPVNRGDRGGLLVPLAGVCAVLGEVCLYHFHYDNVMLVPSAIAMLAVAVTRPAWWSRGLAAVMMSTLWIPHRFITMVPYNGLARAVIWVAVAAVLTKLVAAGSAARLLHRPEPPATT